MSSNATFWIAHNNPSTNRHRGLGVTPVGLLQEAPRSQRLPFKDARTEHRRVERSRRRQQRVERMLGHLKDEQHQARAVERALATEHRALTAQNSRELARAIEQAKTLRVERDMLRTEGSPARTPVRPAGGAVPPRSTAPSKPGPPRAKCFTPDLRRVNGQILAGSAANSTQRRLADEASRTGLTRTRDMVGPQEFEGEVTHFPNARAREILADRGCRQLQREQHMRAGDFHNDVEWQIQLRDYDWRSMQRRGLRE